MTYTEPMVNDRSLSDMGWMVKSQSIPRATADVVIDDAPGMYGYIDMTCRPDGYPTLKPMTVELVLAHYDADHSVIEDDLRELWSEMCGVEATYTPWDGETLSVRGVWNLAVTRHEPRRVEVKATGTCDPEFFGDASTTELPGKVRLDCTRPTFPVFQLEATGGTVSVTNRTTGRHVEVVGDCKAGASVVIDCGTRTATVDGERRSITLASDWMRMLPGDNDVELGGCTGACTNVGRWL